jgi:hypothetical protein
VTTTKKTISYKIIDGQKVPEDVTEFELFKDVYQKPVNQDVSEKIDLDSPVMKDPKTMLEDFKKTDIGTVPHPSMVTKITTEVTQTITLRKNLKSHQTTNQINRRKTRSKRNQKIPKTELAK